MTDWNHLKVMPPALLRSRQRIAWAKTLLMSLFFLGAAAAHIQYAWVPGGGSLALMLGPPLVIHGLLLSLLFGSRIVQHVEYRRQLRDSLLHFPNESDVELDIEHRRERLAKFTVFQQANLKQLEDSSTKSMADFKSTGVFVGVMAGIYALNIVLCQIENLPDILGSLLGYSAMLLTFGVFLGVFVTLTKAQEALDERVMLKVVAREQRALRDMRREIEADELTGALSESKFEPGSAQGGLTQAAPDSAGGLSSFHHPDHPT